MTKSELITHPCKWASNFIKRYFRNSVLVFTLLSFLFLSVFSTHNHHDHNIYLQKHDNVYSFGKKNSSVEDEDEINCIACLWQGIACSTDVFGALIISYENPVQKLIKSPIHLHIETIQLTFQNRAPPSQLSIG